MSEIAFVFHVLSNIFAGITNRGTMISRHHKSLWHVNVCPYLLRFVYDENVYIIRYENAT